MTVSGADVWPAPLTRYPPPGLTPRNSRPPWASTLRVLTERPFAFASVSFAPGCAPVTYTWRALPCALKSACAAAGNASASAAAATPMTLIARTLQTAGQTEVRQDARIAEPGQRRDAVGADLQDEDAGDPVHARAAVRLVVAERRLAVGARRDHARVAQTARAQERGDRRVPL